MKKIIVEKASKIDSIEKAISLVSSDEETIIFIKNGVYKEKLFVAKNNIKFVGEDKKRTIITYDDYSPKVHNDGRDYNTFRTAVVTVRGYNCSLENITIANSSIEPKHHQAIALEVLGDHFKAHNCILTSRQDTLFLGPLPDDLKVRYFDFLTRDELFIESSIYSIFENCQINGAIDYIFGSGSALFKNCSFVSSEEGFVFAPSHSMFQKDGFTLLNCNFISKTKDVKDVYIARPWRAFGKIDVLNCSFDEHIKKDGYTFWNNPHPEIYNRFYEYPKLTCRNDLVKTYSESEYQDLLLYINKTYNF